MSNLGNVTGAITNIASIGFSIAALGLTLELVDRSLNRTSQSLQQGKGKQVKRKPIFDLNYNNNNNNIFNPTSNSKGKKQSSYDFFGGY